MGEGVQRSREKRPTQRGTEGSRHGMVPPGQQDDASLARGGDGAAGQHRRVMPERSGLGKSLLWGPPTEMGIDLDREARE